MKEELNPKLKDILLVSYYTGIEPEILWDRMPISEFNKIYKKILGDAERIYKLMNKGGLDSVKAGGIENVRVLNGYEFDYTCKECNHLFSVFMSGEDISTGQTDIECPECGNIEWLSEEDVDFISEEVKDE